MDADNLALAEGLVSAKYVAQGAQALVRRRRLVKALLSERRLPEAGWDEASIEMLLQARAAAPGRPREDPPPGAPSRDAPPPPPSPHASRTRR